MKKTSEKILGTIVGVVVIVLAFIIYFISPMNDKTSDQGSKTVQNEKEQTKKEQEELNKKKEEEAKKTPKEEVITGDKYKIEDENEIGLTNDKKEIEKENEGKDNKIEKKDSPSKDTGDQSDSSIMESSKEGVDVKINNGLQSSTLGTEEFNGKTFSIVDETEIGKPVKTRTELMVVSEKRMLLIDGEYGTKREKQLMYDITVSGDKQDMHIYLNRNAYNSVRVGTKLKVKYAIYLGGSNKDIEVPVVLDVKTN